MSKATDKFELVMKEFAAGSLRSASGEVVTDRDQALAIAYSESGMKKGIVVKAKTAAEMRKEGLHTNKTKVEIDPEELKMGIKMEMEHTDDKAVAKEIALDHLAEDKAYYTHLAEMEEKHKENGPKRIVKAIVVKSKYTKRWRGSDGRWRYEYAKRKVSNVSTNKEVAAKIKSALEDKGYEIEKSSFSHTSFGDSYYITAGKDGVRVVARISDHGTGMQRLSEYDLHADIRDSSDSIVAKIEKAYLVAKDRASKQKKRTDEMRDKTLKNIDMVAGMVASGELSKTALRKKSKGELAEITGWWDTKDYADKILGKVKESASGNVVKAMMKRIATAIQAPVENVRLITHSELKRIADPPAEYDRRYKLHGRRRVHGMDIAIENAKGTYREGKDADGHPWKTLMKYDYGRIGGTKATDDEGVDVYIGDYEPAEKVYVVHQNDPTSGRYDEDKAMMLFPSGTAAKEAYLGQYDRPGFFGSMSEFSIDEFKQALKCRRGGMLYKSPLEKASRIVVRSRMIKSVEKEGYKTVESSERRTPPKGYPKKQGEYLDPESLKYPVDTESHVRAALSYLSAHGDKYPEDKRRKMWAKLVRAAEKYGIDVSEKVEERAKKSIVVVYGGPK